MLSGKNMKKRQTDSRNERQTIPSALVYALSFFCIVIIWFLTARAIHAPLILPSPAEVFQCFLSLCRTLPFWHHVGATALRVAASFLITIVLGTVLGILCGMSSFFKKFVEVPLTAIRATPVVSFILLALFWLGASFVPVFVSVLMTLPVMVTSITTGVSRTDKKLIDMAQVYHLSRKQKFRYITLASVKPFFASGALSSFGLSWKVVTAGEVLSLPKWGTGELLQIAQVHLETEEVLAVTVTVVILSFVLEQAASFAVHHASQSKRHEKSVCGSYTGKSSLSFSPSPVIVTNFTVTRGENSLYKNFSLTVDAGERLAFIAASGAGKTTMLDSIAGLIDCAESGTIETSSSARISYLFQEPRLIPSCTVYQNVVMPLVNIMPELEARERALSYLTQAGLGDKLSAYPENLSGGEKQRASIARACAFPSNILLMDEAFQSQDIKQKLSLMEILSSMLSSHPRTLILVTHDAREAVCLCTRIVVLTGSPLAVKIDENNTSSGICISERYVNPTESDRKIENKIIESLVKSD